MIPDRIRRSRRRSSSLTSTDHRQASRNQTVRIAADESLVVDSVGLAAFRLVQPLTGPFQDFCGEHAQVNQQGVGVRSLNVVDASIESASGFDECDPAYAALEGRVGR